MAEIAMYLADVPDGETQHRLVNAARDYVIWYLRIAYPTLRTLAQ